MPKQLPVFALFLSAFAVTFLSSIQAQEKGQNFTQEQFDFFETKIRPALIKHCYKCHSQDGDKIKGGLLLDTRDDALQGGDSGPALVPGDLIESLLFTAIQYNDSDLEMPPKYKLENDVIADFKKWIEIGAPDPRKPKAAKPAESYTNTLDVEEGRKFWSYQTPQKTKAPKTEESSKWAKNEIDHFILAAQKEKNLSPAADADANTLIRRLYFDLTGLPPSPDQCATFSDAYAANPDKAVKKAVNKLLSTPQFGERWGRHWLDVARYAESTGMETNAALPHAWRFRDYVIDSFNADKPFDRFITEQLAGDLLESDDAVENAHNTIATGFLVVGTKTLNERNSRQFRFDLVDEQIDTTTRAFLGTTVACARCHDHKFDPIPMSDYYSMAGIFLSSETKFGTSGHPQNSHPTELVALPASFKSGGADKSLAEVIDLEFQKHSLKEGLTDILASISEARDNGDNETANQLRGGIVRATVRISFVEGALLMYDDNGRRLPLAMGMADRAEPFDSQILIRGEQDHATVERAPRGFLQAIQTHDEEPIPEKSSGRLELAHWITSPENPLTTRVFVNRAWLWLFGEGFVSSVDNFGTTGQKPSHPELLDYLAIRFIEMDWSVKDLIREIATSRTYRMSSEFNQEFFDKDPDNRLLWRANKERLDAESIRDSILAISGKIELNRPVGSALSQIGDGLIGRTVSEDRLKVDSVHRAVYLPVVRDLLPDSLSLFDFADPSLISGKREVTTVPSQALYLMNSEFIMNSSKQMANHLLNDLNLRGPELGKTAFYLAYSRPPTKEEGTATLAYFENFQNTARESGMGQDEARNLALSTFCQTLLSSAEFRYVD